MDSKIARMEQITDNNKHITNSIKNAKPVIIERGRTYKTIPYPMEEFFGFNKDVYIDLCLENTQKTYITGNRDFKVDCFVSNGMYLSTLFTDSITAGTERIIDNNKHMISSIKRTRPVITEIGTKYKTSPNLMCNFCCVNNATYI